MTVKIRSSLITDLHRDTETSELIHTQMNNAAALPRAPSPRPHPDGAPREPVAPRAPAHETRGHPPSECVPSLTGRHPEASSARRGTLRSQARVQDVKARSGLSPQGPQRPAAGAWGAPPSRGCFWAPAAPGPRSSEPVHCSTTECQRHVTQTTPGPGTGPLRFPGIPHTDAHGDGAADHVAASQGRLGRVSRTGSHAGPRTLVRWPRTSAPPVEGCPRGPLPGLPFPRARVAAMATSAPSGLSLGHGPRTLRPVLSLPQKS